MCICKSERVNKIASPLSTFNFIHRFAFYCKRYNVPNIDRQFYRHLSHLTTTSTITNTNTIPTNVSDSNIIIMAATTSTCTDKKSSSVTAQESAERNSTVKTLSNDQLNHPPLLPPPPQASLLSQSSALPPSSLSSSSSVSASSWSSVAELLNESTGRAVNSCEIAPLSNNVMSVLNSPADVSSRQSSPTDLLSPVASIKVGVPMGTDIQQGYSDVGIKTKGEKATHPRCPESKLPPVTLTNLIGKATNVSNTDDRSDFSTYTSMTTTTGVTFGNGVDSIYSGDGGSTDVNSDDDKRNKKTTTASTFTNTNATMSDSSNIIGTTPVQSHSQSLLLPQANNQNKWTSTEEPNVSCHSTFETSASSQHLQTRTTVQSRSRLSYPTVESSSTCNRHSLVEQRKRDLFERSQQDTRARSRSRSPITEELQQSSVHFPSVNRLVKMYTKLLQDSKQPTADKDTASNKVSNISEDLTKKMSLREDEDQLKPSLDQHRNSPLSDEGCTIGQSPYSSDCDENQDENRPAKKKKEKVARSASSDSALGLDEEPMEPPPANMNQGRRMTLTVTDLPLRPALLPLAEPTDLPDSPTAEVQISLNTLIGQSAIPSKVLIEERVVEIPEDRFGSMSSSRRESAQSCISDYPASECGGVRFVRTPSVVVSDYSDDLMCGITLEEIEYFRAQRLRRRSSVETSGTEKDDAASDVSATSSCSNLYYCGSTISALDGAECYVNGIRMPIDRKISDCSTFEGSGDEDNNQSFVIPEQPEDLKDYISYYTEQMVTQQQNQQQRQPCRKSKKVGGIITNSDTETCNANTSYCEQ